MTTVERIFALMEEQGITAYRLSKETGISSGNISDWKKGNITPSASALAKIAEYFNVSVDYLLGYDYDDLSKRFNEALLEKRKQDYVRDLQYELSRKTPSTKNAQRINKAMQKMPPAEQEKLMNILEIMFAEYFADG